jgi:hypothetical protein
MDEAIVPPAHRRTGILALRSFHFFAIWTRAIEVGPVRTNLVPATIAGAVVVVGNHDPESCVINTVRAARFLHWVLLIPEGTDGHGPNAGEWFC